MFYTYKKMGGSSSLDGMLCKIREELKIPGSTKYVYVDVITPPIKRDYTTWDVPCALEDGKVLSLFQLTPIRKNNLHPLPDPPKIEDCM